MRIYLFHILLFLSALSFGQSTATVEGSVYTMEGRALGQVFLKVKGTKYSTTSNDDGSFQLTVPADKRISIYYAYLRSRDSIVVGPLAENSVLKRNVRLQQAQELKVVDVKADPVRGNVSVIRLDPKKFERFSNTAGFEQVLALTMPGVSSAAGELSSAYNVRGGNFDENLVYVNDISIYRPFLVRSGQQEGLSIINSDMIESLTFSAGGFQAKYGDKLSSVLDITYSKPDSFKSTIHASFLGANVHIEGVGKRKKRFSYLIGARYRSNQYLLGSLDVQGDYKPRFYDVQSLLSYNINSQLNLSWLTSVSQNRYLVAPQSRRTAFGNFNTPLSLFVAFGGEELMEYTTFVNGLNLTYKPNIGKHQNTELKLIASSYNSFEREHFTVEGAYQLGELDNDLGSDNFGQLKSLIGIGYFIDHARNDLQAQVYTLEHKGKSIGKKGRWEWGGAYSRELISDRLKELRYNDSSDHNISTTRDTSLVNQVVLDEFLKAEIDINSFRVNGYIQNSRLLSAKNGMRWNYGLRANYWSLNNETVWSPRTQLSFLPNKAFNTRIRRDTSIATAIKDTLLKRDWLLKAAFGFYYQPPFYRELRRLDGTLNTDLKAQRSIHAVLGADLNFKAWNRPFKFVSEVYYKHLDRMVPYVIDNVRIRYLAENSSQGYAAGLDARVNGEFVKGIESYFNIGILSTQERLYYNDENGVEQLSDWLRRPTDQRVNFSILFQDELPSNPDYKMNLSLVYGTNVPFYFNPEARHLPGFKIPAYRRVDIGFSKVLIEGDDRRPNWLKGANSLWASIDIFNLLKVNNTISYILVKDFSNNVYGVPNYLTGRRINLRIIAKF